MPKKNFFLRNNKLFILFIFLTVILFFYKFFIKNFLPIPLDTIVGLYNPFRDFYSKIYPNGIPFKNFLITDPVRQIIPWKILLIDSIFKFNLPIWNPYEMAGTPLLANFQSAVFYPLNVLFLIKPFYFAWSIFIFLQPLLIAIFTFYYLVNLNLSRKAALLGALVFSFSAFSIVWLEWGNILHTALWLPLILLSIDKIIIMSKKRNIKEEGLIQILSDKGNWFIVFIFSLILSFFAGHLQIFLYLFIFSSFYLIFRIIQFKNLRIIWLFLVCYLIFLAVTIVQWLPTLQFIFLSARSIDQADWLSPGWFIPWQNLIQFLSPDFFGNPVTLNYWGVWNYAELVGYIGILPLIFALYAIFKRFDKKTFFFGTAFFLSLIFSLPTFFARLPFSFKIPFLSTAQPTRLLFLTDFSLSILSSFGFDYFLNSKKSVRSIYIFLAAIILSIWLFISFLNNKLNLISPQNISVARRNMILPTIIFFISILIVSFYEKVKSKKNSSYIYLILIIIILFDLLRFAFKFTPFTNKNYFFPKTKILTFLENQPKPFRIASSDRRIFPPNFSVYYKIESIEGYDPLYLLSYAEFVTALERNKPDVNSPFGFNRIITPHNISSGLMDFLGVNYLLSLDNLNLPKLEQVLQEGETRVYRNKNAFPRAFFVKKVIFNKTSKEIISGMFTKNLRDVAFIEERPKFEVGSWDKDKLEISDYKDDKITLITDNKQDSFLVLTNSFYPSWKVSIDEKESKIYKTDYAFQGIFVPAGKHKIIFFINLF